jgi:ribosomal protein S18 acetylase RimI-like enzyme
MSAAPLSATSSPLGSLALLHSAMRSPLGSQSHHRPPVETGPSINHAPSSGEISLPARSTGTGSLTTGSFEAILHSPALPLGVRVASLGVRGVLSLSPISATENQNREELIRASDAPDLKILAAEGLALLREAGVRRVHHLCNRATESVRSELSGLGFAPSPGETLLVCDLTARQRVDLPLPPSSYELRGASEADVESLRSLIASVPELAILDWEWDLVQKGLHTPSRQALMVEYNSAIVGALIGGHSECHAHGRQGTVSHLWVAPEHRHSGLGRCMTAHALTRFIAAEVREAHVMTTAGNEPANAFWRSMGFTPRPESFLEVDL